MTFLKKLSCVVLLILTSSNVNSCWEGIKSILCCCHDREQKYIASANTPTSSQRNAITALQATHQSPLSSTDSKDYFSNINNDDSTANSSQLPQSTSASVSQTTESLPSSSTDSKDFSANINADPILKQMPQQESTTIMVQTIMPQCEQSQTSSARSSSSNDNDNNSHENSQSSISLENPPYQQKNAGNLIFENFLRKIRGPKYPQQFTARLPLPGTPYDAYLERNKPSAKATNYLSGSDDDDDNNSAQTPQNNTMAHKNTTLRAVASLKNFRQNSLSNSYDNNYSNVGTPQDLSNDNNGNTPDNNTTIRTPTGTKIDLNSLVFVEDELNLPNVPNGAKACRLQRSNSFSSNDSLFDSPNA